MSVLGDFTRVSIVGFLSFLAPACLRVAVAGASALFRVVAKGTSGAVRRTIVLGGARTTIRIKPEFRPHAMGRAVQRGISNKEIRRTLREGSIYWDTKNQSYSFFRKRADGKYTQVAYDSLGGVIRTVTKTRRIPKRMVKVPH